MAPGVADAMPANILPVMQIGGPEEARDGRRPLVLFRLTENRREARHDLYARLRGLGFAPLYDGAWGAPRAGTEETALALDELGPAVGHRRARARRRHRPAPCGAGLTPRLRGL